MAVVAKWEALPENKKKDPDAKAYFAYAGLENFNVQKKTARRKKAFTASFSIDGNPNAKANESEYANQVKRSAPTCWLRIAHLRELLKIKEWATKAPIRNAPSHHVMSISGTRMAYR